MTSHSWKALPRCAIIGAVSLLGTYRMLALAQLAEGPIPLWHFDLQEYGYNDRKPWSEAMNRIAVAFTSDRALAITYHFAQGPALRAVFFRPLTGERLASHSWPAASELLPTRDGRFLVRDKDGLALYSAELERIRGLNIDCSHPRYYNWCYDVRTTSDGAVIFIDQGNASSFTLQKMDSDTFVQLGSWTSQRNFLGLFEAERDSISDQRIISTGDDFKAKFLYMRYIDKPWPAERDSRFKLVTDPNWHAIHHVKRGFIDWPTFITDDLIALYESGTVVLLKADGTVLLRDHVARWPNYLVDNPVGSRDGRRFAVKIATQLLNFSDFPGVNRFVRVVVYDSREGRIVFNLDQRPGWSENVALSPDGTILAVQHGSSLDAFRLPQ